MINNYNVSNETKTIFCLSPKSSNNKNYEISVSKLVEFNFSIEFNLNPLSKLKFEDSIFKICIISRYDKAYSNFGYIYSISLDSYIKEFKTQHNKIKDFKYRIITTVFILYEIPVYEFIEKMKQNGIYIEGGYQFNKYKLTYTEIRLGFILKILNIENVAYNINDPDLLLNNKSELYKKIMVYKYNKLLKNNIKYLSVYNGNKIDIFREVNNLFTIKHRKKYIHNIVLKEIMENKMEDHLVLFCMFPNKKKVFYLKMITVSEVNMEYLKEIKYYIINEENNEEENHSIEDFYNYINNYNIEKYKTIYICKIETFKKIFKFLRENKIIISYKSSRRHILTELQYTLISALLKNWKLI